MTSHTQKYQNRRPWHHILKIDDTRENTITQLVLLFADIQSSSHPNSQIRASIQQTSITSAFPQTFSKPVGKSRQKYFFGLDNTAEVEHSFTSNEKEQLRICVLEERVEQLKKEKSSASSSQLSSEFLSLLKPEHCVYHHPDSIVHFNSFSMDTVIYSWNSPPTCTDYWSHWERAHQQMLVDRQLEEVRAASSLCILLSISQSSWSSAAHSC